MSLTALLDGLWLEWCRDPRAFTADQAISACYGMLDGLLGGGFSERSAADVPG